jgi:hypothetical protein
VDGVRGGGGWGFGQQKDVIISQKVQEDNSRTLSDKGFKSLRYALFEASYSKHAGNFMCCELTSRRCLCLKRSEGTDESYVPTLLGLTCR